MAGKIT